MKRKIQVAFLSWLVCMLVVLFVEIMTAPAGKPVAVSTKQPIGKVLGAVTTQARGSQTPEEVLHAKQTTNLEPSGLTAASFLVYDASSGETLLTKNADKKYPIASLTKLMTALVTYNNSALNQTATIAPKDLVSISPNLSLRVGDVVSVQDLFNAMLVGSENDAAQALANHVASSSLEFIKQMNEMAENLDMVNTKYSNPIGFDSLDNYSTAEDLKKLVNETQKLTAFTSLGRRLTYSFKAMLGSYTSQTTNKLLATHPEIEAVKSGQTPSAKQSLISKIAVGDHKIIVIVLGSDNREKDTLTLEKFVEENFVWE